VLASDLGDGLFDQYAKSYVEILVHRFHETNQTRRIHFAWPSL